MPKVVIPAAVSGNPDVKRDSCLHRNAGGQMDFDKQLDELFIELPEPPLEKGFAAGAVQSGKFLHIGGTLPLAEGRIQFPGRVGIEVRLENARAAARYAAILALSLARKELGGSIKKIARVVRVDGFIACSADFRDHTKVIDGASELYTQIFGKNGRHVQTAVGAFCLPNNSCVEISVLFETK